MMKNLLIIGDSYSTYKGVIPKEYPAYYSLEGEQNLEVSKMAMVETWWGRLCNGFNVNLIHNNSWSGSTICYTGYEGDCSHSSSFIYRYRQLQERGFFLNNSIDTIFVFGGTNDSWANAPLGSLQFDNWSENDLFQVLPAVCYFMRILKDDLLNAKIVFLINCDIKIEIIQGIKCAGCYFGVETIELQDIEKESGHPTIKGMEQIYTQIIKNMEMEGKK